MRMRTLQDTLFHEDTVLSIAMSVATIIVIALWMALFIPTPAQANSGKQTPWPEGVQCEKPATHQRLITNQQGYITGVKRFYVCSDGHSYQWTFKLQNPAQ